MQKSSFWLIIPEAVGASMLSSVLAVNSTTIYSFSLSTSMLPSTVGTCLMKVISAEDKNHFFFTGALNCNGILNHNYGLEGKKNHNDMIRHWSTQ